VSSNSENNRSCVITRLEGGLGNQLFMYAAARRLAHHNGVPLKIETQSGFEVDIRFKRTLMLRHFNIAFTEATAHEAFVGEDRRKYYTRKINRLLPFGRRTFIEERKEFEPRLLSLRVRRPVFLQGYWQDERYFEDIADLLRNEIAIPATGQDQDFADLDWPATVGIHFRRIDYDHLLPVEYYRSCIETIEQDTPGQTYLAIGDDQDFIRNNAPAIFPDTAKVIIPDQPADQLEDFNRLLRCGRLIIANSSFSWWAAWLNNCPDKQVWAPRNWGYMARASRHWNLI
jgi:hypothetical protein